MSSSPRRVAAIRLRALAALVWTAVLAGCGLAAPSAPPVARDEAAPESLAARAQSGILPDRASRQHAPDAPTGAQAPAEPARAHTPEDARRATMAPRESAHGALVAAALDARMQHWLAHVPAVGNNFACAMTCHTALPFALARPLLAAPGSAQREVVGALAKRLEAADTWLSGLSFYGEPRTRLARQALATEAVLNALALEGLAQGEEPAPAGRASAERGRALRALASVQRADGGFDWLDFGLEPWESGDELFGAALAARAFAAAPPEDAARLGAHRAASAAFVRARLGAKPRLFSELVVAWAADTAPELLSDAERAALAARVAERQDAEGALSWRALGVPNKVDAGDAPDAVPTAYVALAFCRRASAAQRAPGERALAWLRAHELPDGSFAARSPNRNAARSHRYFSDAATGLAALARARCDSVP